VIDCIAVIAVSGAVSSLVFLMTHRAGFIWYTFILSVLVALALLPGMFFSLASCFGSGFHLRVTDALFLAAVCAAVAFPVPFAFAIRRWIQANSWDA
jgi:hypothetical protein